MTIDLPSRRTRLGFTLENLFSQNTKEGCDIGTPYLHSENFVLGLWTEACQNSLTFLRQKLYKGNNVPSVDLNIENNKSTEPVGET